MIQAPSILRRRYIEAGLVAPPVRIGGEFMLQIRRLDGSIRQTVGPFPNLVLDNGLNLIGSTGGGGDVWSTVAVGSGNTAPANNQTQLQTLVASNGAPTNSSTFGNPSSPYECKRTRKWSFGFGVAAGNLSELGVGPSATNLFARSLIKDAGGNPTTITVLSTEALDVYYTTGIYPPLSDYPFVLTIGATNYNCVSRAASAGTYGVNNWLPIRGAGPTDPYYHAVAYSSDATLGLITATPTASQTFDTGPASNFIATSASYVAGNFFRDCTYSISTSQANLSGGWGALLIHDCMGIAQISFSPAIPKDNLKSMSLTYRAAWARYV